MTLDVPRFEIRGQWPRRPRRRRRSTLAGPFTAASRRDRRSESATARATSSIGANTAIWCRRPTPDTAAGRAPGSATGLARASTRRRRRLRRTRRRSGRSPRQARRRPTPPQLAQGRTRARTAPAESTPCRWQRALQPGPGAITDSEVSKRCGVGAEDLEQRSMIVRNARSRIVERLSHARVLRALAGEQEHDLERTAFGSGAASEVRVRGLRRRNAARAARASAVPLATTEAFGEINRAARAGGIARRRRADTPLAARGQPRPRARAGRRAPAPRARGAGPDARGRALAARKAALPRG